MSRTQCLHYLVAWRKEHQPIFSPTPSTRELAATPDVLLRNNASLTWCATEDPDVIYVGEVIRPKKIKRDPDMPPPKRVRYTETRENNLTIREVPLLYKYNCFVSFTNTHIHWFQQEGYPSISRGEILRRVFKPATQNDPLEAQNDQSPMPAPGPAPGPAPLPDPHFPLALQPQVRPFGLPPLRFNPPVDIQPQP